MRPSTWLHKQIGWSPLSAQAVVRPKGSVAKRVFISSLVLTSLVDAFSILVIFLLMNASTGIESINVGKGTKLPMAQSAETITEGVILKFEDDQYFIGETAVPLDKLASALGEEKKKELEKTGKENVPLIVQADKNVDYKDLSPLFEMGAVNGFEQYKLAVLQDESPPRVNY